LFKRISFGACQRLKKSLSSSHALAMRDSFKQRTTKMEIDTIATHDAQAIQRLVDNGEPLSTVSAKFGYTPTEAQELLDHAQNNHHILLGWWK
jgi:hypothetical protein